MKSLPQIVLPRLKRLLGYGDNLYSLLYTWDPLAKLIRAQNAKSVRFVRNIIMLSNTYVIGQLASILVSDSFIERFHGAIFSVFYVAFSIVRFELEPNPEIVQLLNLLCYGTLPTERNGIKYLSNDAYFNGQ